MVSVNFQNNVKVYQTGGTQKVQTAPLPAQNNDRKTVSTPVAFRAEGYQSTLTVRTELSTKSEQKKYKEISEVLSGKYKKKLDYALKSGILLKNDSDDKSSVLDNLHKILKEERDKGLDSKTILEECLDIIENPYVITQTCEDIPEEYKTEIIGLVTNLTEDVNEIQEANFNLDNMHTGTCPTASVEFDLATKIAFWFERLLKYFTFLTNAFKSMSTVFSNILNLFYYIYFQVGKIYHSFFWQKNKRGFLIKTPQ